MRLTIILLHKHYMTPHSEGGKTLLEISLTSLKAEKVTNLRQFCAEYGLQVARTGKRGVSVKVDYVNAIMSHVSACRVTNPKT